MEAGFPDNLLGVLLDGDGAERQIGGQFGSRLAVLARLDFQHKNETLVRFLLGSFLNLRADLVAVSGNSLLGSQREFAVDGVDDAGLHGTGAEHAGQRPLLKIQTALVPVLVNEQAEPASTHSVND